MSDKLRVVSSSFDRRWWSTQFLVVGDGTRAEIVAACREHAQDSSLSHDWERASCLSLKDLDRECGPLRREIVVPLLPTWMEEA